MVNLASRLEGINKVYGTRVIIAEDALRLAQDEVEVRELDLITVAGKAELSTRLSRKAGSVSC